MAFLYSKSLHIIFVVTWFAGLFYIPRLFIYVTEAESLTEPGRRVLQDQLRLMQRRLWYGITWPSAVVTLALGLNTWYQYGATPDWLIYKLGLVLGLYLYHGSCHVLFRQQQRGELRYTSNQLRIWNEVATLFLFAIVFLVILKDALNMLWGMLGLFALLIVLLLAIRLYRRIRKA
ncbi:CopD family protein [Spirosoma sp. 209]|uniref:CopD family protein n=1 Tax=Spirosoma sp. 209 TaxID=1955701 RepID=UPI00098D59D8|nr:CopD family protein [Spirosoma sp. 209]